MGNVITVLKNIYVKLIIKKNFVLEIIFIFCEGILEITKFYDFLDGSVFIE